MNRLAHLCCLSTLALTACGGDPEPPAPFEHCAEQHTEDGIHVCDRAFADHPRVHLPPDVLGADGTTVTIHAALDPQDDRSLILRDGSRAVLADATGRIIPFAETASDRVPDGFAWPSYEFLETIYELTGTATHIDIDVLGTPTSTFAVLDATVRPIVRLRPEVIDGVIAGSWEGTLSRRIGDNMYDPDARVPIRVRWTGYDTEHQIIPHWTPGDGELTYALIASGTIDNASQALTLADGTCAPALDSLGAASPIADVGAAVTMVRIPAMHVPGDYQLGWNGGMGPIAPVHPGAAIQDAARAEFLATSSAPHGTPNGMRLEEFRAVAAGGTPCTP